MILGIVFAGPRIKGMGVKIPPEREVYVISVVSSNGESVVLRDETGLEISLHRSLIDDNGLSIEQGILRLEASFYKYWFGEAREREAEKRLDELWKLYRDNVPLFYRSRERILADEKLVYTPIPFSVWNVRAPILLGAMAKAWDSYPDVYCHECPECKGTTVIFFFAGSPLSGRSSTTAICLECGILSKPKCLNFGKMRRPVSDAMGQYPRRSEIEPYGSLEEIISLLSESEAIE